jgi:hypothetical protein
VFRPVEWCPLLIPFPYNCYFNVGAAIGASFQNTLELNLFKKLEVRDHDAVLWHDGTLTAGRGAVARAVVLDAVREFAPQLLNGDRVELLRFDIREQASVAKATELLERCALYAFARNQVRERVKVTRKTKRRG